MFLDLIYGVTCFVSSTKCHRGVTFAGSTPGFGGDGGLATQAQLFQPTSMWMNAQNETFIADFGNCRKRKVDSQGIVSTIFGGVGGCESTGDWDLATQASGQPYKLCGDSRTGDVYFIDKATDVLRKINVESGMVSTVAGSQFEEEDAFGFHESDDSLLFDYRSAYLVTGDDWLPSEVSATSFSLLNPTSCQVDGQGDVYLVDRDASAIFKVTSSTGMLSLVAGDEAVGGLRSLQPEFPSFQDIHYSPADDTLYVATFGRGGGVYAIQHVSDPDRLSSVAVAVSSAIDFAYLHSITVDSELNILVMDQESRTLYILDGSSGIIASHSVDSLLGIHEMQTPSDIAQIYYHGKNLYSVDTLAGVVRRVPFAIGKVEEPTQRSDGSAHHLRRRYWNDN